MRIIREFIYDSWLKTLKYWDMSWEQYTRYFYQPDEVIKEILTEFQETPDLSNDDMSFFIVTCFTEITGVASLHKKRDGNHMVPEHHIPMGYLMFHLHQQYSEIMSMPARLVFLLLNDIAIFSGQEEYDPDRRLKSIDRDAIKKVFGKTSGSVK